MLLCLPFSLFQTFNLIPYSEDYLITFSCLSRWLSSYSFSQLPLMPYLSFLIITIGFMMLLITMKAVISVSMIVGNLIDVYLFGMIAVLMNWLLYTLALGWVLGCLLLYLFSTNVSVFLVCLFTLELFSTMFQSITLANRLSINLMAGSLSMQLMIVAVVLILSSSYWIILSVTLLFLLFIFTFEMVNCRMQLFTFGLLSLEYSVDYLMDYMMIIA